MKEDFDVRETLSVLLDEVRQLRSAIDRMQNDRYPKYVGTSEACQILGIGRTTMMQRLQNGEIPFAFQDNGRWRFNLVELYRFQSQI